MKLNRILKYVLTIMSFMIVLNFQVNARGWIEKGGDWYYQDQDGEFVTETIKTSEGKKYYLGEDGRMVRDFLLVDYNEATYYFNDDGEMVVNTWVAVDPQQVTVDISSSAGLTVYLFYFGGNGKAFRAKNTSIIRKTIDGKKYLFNTDGVMLSGWIDESGNMWNDYDNDTDPFVGALYYAGDETDGVLRSGWMGFTDGSIDDKYFKKEVIWFYFGPTSNKKMYYGQEGSNNELDYLSKYINGKQYAFDENGVMLTAWEADKATKYYIEEEDPYSADHGILNKRRWIYTVPSEEIDLDDYTDEVSRWFYSDNSGNLYRNIMKRINNDYYVFDRKGIMRDSLVIVSARNKYYVDRVDVENTNGKDFIVSREYATSENNEKEKRIFNSDTDVLYYFDTDESSNKYGSRKTGTVRIQFNDMEYVFFSDKSGSKEGYRKKKYYQSGMELAADPMLGYGLLLDYIASDSVIYAKSNKNLSYKNGTLNSDITNDYKIYYDLNKYSETSGYPHLRVIMTNRSVPDKSYSAIKDKEGNYWMIGANNSFIKVVSVPIKYDKRLGKWFFKSDYTNANEKTVNGWIECDTILDTTGQYVSEKRGEGNYEVIPNDLYAVNFDWRND